MSEALEGEIVEPKKPRKKRRDTRIKDKLFAEAYIRNNCDATKAALEVTNASNKQSAAAMGSRMLKRNIEDIQNRMEKYGLTDKKVMTKHAQLVDSENDNVAMKAVETYYKVTKKEGGSDQNVTIHFNF
jgi:hypothetical protein